jgi:hypothetical protein
MGTPVVTNATTKSPDVSASARITHGRLLDPVKSLNGNAERTISPTFGMAPGIWIAVAGFYVFVRVQIRFILPKERWPEAYGIGGHPVPKGYLAQFKYPFSK